MKKLTSKYILLFLTSISVLVYFSMTYAPYKEFEAIESEFLEFYFETNPITATWIGNHAFDGRLPDLSEESIQDQLTVLYSFQSKLENINSLGLRDYRRHDLQILSHSVDERIFNLTELKSHIWNPLYYISSLGYAYESIANYDFAPVTERMKSLIGRLNATDTFVKQAMMNLVAMPEPHLETAIHQLDALIRHLDIGYTEQKKHLSEDIRGRLSSSLDQAIPALISFKSFLEERMANGPHRTFRIGQDLFQQKLHYTLNEGISSKEVLARAESQLKFIQGEMLDLALPLYEDWFKETPILNTHAEQLKLIRRVMDEISIDHVSRDDVVNNANGTIDELIAFIEANDIITLDPKHPLEIRETPEYQRGVSIASLQSPGPLESNLPTYYNVSPVPVDWTDEQAESFLKEYNNFSVKILSIHEALPGHYVQLYYANRHPSLVRSVFSSGVMVEGWAHYVEDMMIDEGFGQADPRLKLVERKWKLRGIANAIMDYRIHADNMTKDEAMALMIDETFQEESEATGKWRRAQLTSTQLSTYFTGYSLMWDLRRDVEDTRGGEFNLKEFHEELLSHGSIPIRFLRQELLKN